MDEPTREQAEPAGRPTPAASGEPESISTGRKVRLVVLIAILAALTVTTFIIRARDRRKEEQREQAVAASLEGLRVTLGALEPGLAPEAVAARLGEAGLLYSEIKQLDPENQEADRLAVALLYAGGQTLEAIQLFNSLDVQALAAEHAREAASGGGTSPYGLAEKALAPYPELIGDAARPEIVGEDVEYVRRTGLLWGLSHSIVPSGTPDTEKALLLCRWLALHVRPDESAPFGADPYSVVRRGYGSPEELTWTFCELARQIGLASRVVVAGQADPAEGRQHLAQVYPADGPPFLVNPFLGVPVLGTGSDDRLSLETLQRRTQAVGLPPGADPEAGQEAGVALNPLACYPRMMAFEHVLQPLATHPRLAMDIPGPRADREVILWEAPIRILRAERESQGRAEVAIDSRPMQPIAAARAMHLQGQCALARRLYDAALADLEAKLNVAEVEEAVAFLQEATDHAAFFRATNAYDAGLLTGARHQLEAYLADRPKGRWAGLAKVGLAEALNDLGETEAAAALWQDLPPHRQAFGSLRLRGLLAGAPVPVAPTAPALPTSP
jgi:hypothetical protein